MEWLPACMVGHINAFPPHPSLRDTFPSKGKAWGANGAEIQVKAWGVGNKETVLTRQPLLSICVFGFGQPICYDRTVTGKKLW